MSSAAGIIIVSMIGKPSFHDQFEKIIKHYKNVVYSLDVIMVRSYGILLNCTKADQALDSMTTLT